MKNLENKYQFILRDILHKIKKYGQTNIVYNNPPNFNYNIQLNFQTFLDEYLMDDVVLIMTNLHSQTLELVKYVADGIEWNAIVPIIDRIIVNNKEGLLTFTVSHYWLNKVVSGDFSYKDVDISSFQNKF